MVVLEAEFRAAVLDVVARSDEYGPTDLAFRRAGGEESEGCADGRALRRGFGNRHFRVS